VLSRGPQWPCTGRDVEIRISHHSVYACFLARNFSTVWPRCSCDVGVQSTAVPEAAHVVARDDLREAACLDVADLDESGVEEEDIGVVQCYAFRRPLPFDGPDRRPTGIAMFVNIEAELCRVKI
jgi:hypothetical protein